MVEPTAPQLPNYSLYPSNVQVETGSALPVETPADTPQDSSNWGLLVWVLMVVIGLALLVFGGYWMLFRPYLVVESQPFGPLMTIDEARLTEPGFVTIYNVNRYGKRGVRLLGRTELLPPDTYERFTIDVDVDSIEADTGELLIEPGSTVIVAVQRQADVSDPENIERFSVDQETIVRDVLQRQVLESITLF